MDLDIFKSRIEHLSQVEKDMFDFIINSFPENILMDDFGEYREDILSLLVLVSKAVGKGKELVDNVALAQSLEETIYAIYANYDNVVLKRQLTNLLILQLVDTNIPYFMNMNESELNSLLDSFQNTEENKSNNAKLVYLINSLISTSKINKGTKKSLSSLLSLMLTTRYGKTNFRIDFDYDEYEGNRILVVVPEESTENWDDLLKDPTSSEVYKEMKDEIFNLIHQNRSLGSYYKLYKTPEYYKAYFYYENNLLRTFNIFRDNDPSVSDIQGSLTVSDVEFLGDIVEDLRPQDQGFVGSWAYGSNISEQTIKIEEDGTDVTVTDTEGLTTTVSSDISLYVRLLGAFRTINFYGDSATYYVKRGTSINDGLYSDSSFTTLVDIPEATGSTPEHYTYTWTNNNQTPFDFNTKIYTNQNFVVLSTPNVYQVKFYDGETLLSTQNVTYNTTATEPTGPSKTGYTFDDWYTSSSFTTIFDFTTPITSNTNIYAKYEINEYEVKFYSVEGTQFGTTQMVEYGSLATAPTTNPTRENHEFIGWDFTFTTQITANTNIYAVWDIDKFTVKFYDFQGTGNTLLYTMTDVPYDTYISAPSIPNPTRESHNFTGWNFNFSTTKITSNTAIYGAWQIKTYNIKFYDYFGGTQIGSTQVINWGENATAPTNPTRPHYTFDKWDKAFTNIKADTNVYGLWNKAIYKVKFYTAAGTQYGETQSIQYLDKATQPTNPTKTGYTFTNWRLGSESGSVFNFNTPITEDINLYATFTVNIYTVKYYHGTNLLKTLSIAYNTKVNASDVPTAPIVTGYTFSNWDFDATVYTITENKNINAVYTINKYNVKFYDYSGGIQIGSTQIVEYGKAATAPTTPTREGYNWAGWDRAFNNITGHLNVYGTWNIKTFSVKFYNWEGGTQIGQTQIINWNEAATAPSTPTRTGYNWLGWDKAFTNVKSNLDVYGTWVIQTFTVKFYNALDEVIKTEIVNYNANATAPTTPTKEGHTFTGWDTVFTNVKANLNVKPTYTINTYTVKFFVEGTQVGQTQTINWNEAAIAPADPSKEGYNFTGWDKAFTNIKSNLDINAVFAIKAFLVKFFIDGTEDTSLRQTVNWNTTAIQPSNPVKTGYTFTSWRRSNPDGTVYDFSTKVTTNVNLYANFIINKYTVKFYDYVNGSTTPLHTYTNVEHGTILTAPEDPTISGYVFSGWDYDLSQPITGNTNIYGTWSINTYAVKFYVDGVLSSTQNVAYGAKATKPANPSKTGYTFNSWKIGSTSGSTFDFNTSITQNYNLHAKFDIMTFSVKFYDYSGTGMTLLKDETVNYGSDAIAPTIPSRPGYTFNSWDKAFTNVTSNLNVYGLWNEAKFTVNFYDYQGGSTTPVHTITNVAYNSLISDPRITPTRQYYIFKGWNFNFSTTRITQDTNIYGTWELEKYIVRFMNGVNVYSTVSVTRGNKVTRPTTDPTKTGYTFDKWRRTSETGQEFDFNNTYIHGPMDIYASYTINTYTVKFYSEGALYETQTVNYGDKAIKPTTDPTKSNYQFTSWRIGSASGSAYDFNTAVSSNLNLYANFTINTYTVKFWARPDLVYSTQTIEHGGDATNPGTPNVVVTGYDFDGWDGTYTNVTSNLDIHAKWKIKTYTVKFYNYSGGTLLSTQTIDYGNDATAPTQPTRTGYSWEGWDKAYTNITQDTNIYGTWEINKYTVKFYDYVGGSTTPLKTQLVPYQSNATPPTNPTRQGYIFKGWSGTYTNITQDTNIYGTWAVAYEVILDGNGGKYGTADTKTLYVEYNTPITTITNNSANIPTREHYIFDKYYGTQEVTTKYIGTANVGILEFIKWFILGSPETTSQMDSWSRPYCYSIIRDRLSLNTTFKEYSILNTSGENWNISLANSSYIAYDGDNYKQDGNIVFWTNSANINALKNTSYYNSSTNSLVIPNGYYLEIIAATDETSGPNSNDFRFSFAVEELQEITVITEDITLYANYKFDPKNVSILGSATYNSATYQPFEYKSASGVTYFIPESITPDLTITNNIPSRETVNKYFKGDRYSGKITNNFISSNQDLSERQNSSEITYLIQGDNITNRILTIAHSSSLVWEDTGMIGPDQGYNITVNLSIGNKTITKTYPVTWNNTFTSYNSQGDPNLFVTNVSEIFQVDLSNETEAVWNSVLNVLGSKKLGSPIVIIKKEIKGNNEVINGTYINNDIQSVNGYSTEMLETGFIDGSGDLYTPTSFGLKVTGYLYLNTKNKEPLTKVLYEGNNLSV